jgi:hypothetical protein
MHRERVDAKMLVMRALPLLAAATWLLALSVHGAATRPARAEDPVEKPLPLTRTTVLKDTRVVYVVDGRQTIPPGVEITGQKGIRIQGRNGAVLEVRGAFVVHGISGTPVRISGVRIEPGESVQQLHLDYCTFSGSHVATEEGKTTGGMITVENCSFASGGGVRVGITRGKVGVMSVTGSTGVRIRGVDPENATNRVQAMIYGCKLTDGLEIENVYDVVVRSTLLEGSPLALRANRTLLFDSNRVASGTLEITQPRTGEFKGTTITKCDFYMQTLRIFSPAADGASDVVALDKCWFSAGNDPDLIAKVVEDSADDPENAVKVRLKNPSDKPHNLVTDD